MHVQDPGFRPADYPRPARPRREGPVDGVSLSGAGALPPAPGEARTFFVWDTGVMPPRDRQAAATARAVTERVSIFVEDSLWGSKVTAQDVERLKRLFTERGPAGSADPSRSIYDVSTAYFGAPPTAPNGSDHTVLLIADLPAFKTTVLDGYVNPFDQMTDEEARKEGQRSNETNVLYLNGTGSTGVASDYMQGVLAHEFQHLLHHRHDPEEESWLNELASQASMLANGYHTDMGHVARYASRPDRPLVSPTYVDYGAELLFAEYLMERYGKAFYAELVASPAHGVESLDATLARLGRPERFRDLYTDWLVANYADSQGAAEPGFHYARLDVPKMAESAPVGKVSPTGARYVRLDLPAAARVSLGGDVVGQVFRVDGMRVDRRPPGEVLPAGSWIVAVGNLGAEAADYRVDVQPA